MKQAAASQPRSVFIPPVLVERARRNAQTDPWCAAAVQTLIAGAAPWHALGDAALWDMMFGPTIRRAWLVGGDGACPACKAPVPMYNWKIDALRVPWKVACRHCGGLFPTNDFQAFYRSGLDRRGVFDPARADRRKLANQNHPDPADPLHRFGVDDGGGYAADGHEWRFIGAYLIYGAWKQAVLGGIRALSEAFVVSGDRSYARQAAILLDRVADLFPDFDFARQAFMYEKNVVSNGYVSTWHDSNREVLDLALAYDQIRPALADDHALVAFLSAQAREHGLENPKASCDDIRRNIEDRIFRDALLRHPERVVSNYPRDAILMAVLVELLGDPGCETVVAAKLDAMLEHATRVDGITGEKGLPSYSMYTIAALAEYLALLQRREPDLLPKLLERHPRLRQTYRFHFDVRCLDRYCPNIGDAAAFAMPVYSFGVFFGKAPATRPSMYTFLMDLYRATGDRACLGMVSRGAADNRYVPGAISKAADLPSGSGAPYDLFADDPAAFRGEMAGATRHAGSMSATGSLNLEKWALAILRGGEGENARAVWLDYDIGGGHGHGDGLNLGLYARGLDLMPDNGYPQIQFGGWGSPKGMWYGLTAAHNTVVVDGRDQGHQYKGPAVGRTRRWTDGKILRAVRAALGAFRDPLPQFFQVGRQHVALYAYAPARFRAVRIWVDPGSTGDWQPAFSDDFKRAELGADWKVLSGDWRLEDGWLAGRGTILCTRVFHGPQRLEYEARAAGPEPCDLSAYLSCDAAGQGIFFGFGSARNTGSKLLVNNELAAAHPRIITPGRIHRVSSRYENRRLQMHVDGELTLDCDHMVNLAARLIFGDDAPPKQFERSAILVDVSPADAYVLDIFRVVGGSEHARFFHSAFGALATEGVKPDDAVEFGPGVLIRNARSHRDAPPGWRATWTIEDRYGLLPPGARVHLRHIDLTRSAEACVGESWVNAGDFNTIDERWIPVLVTRRRGTAPLNSTFVALMEPYGREPFIAGARRLDLAVPGGHKLPDSIVAVEVALADGRRDLLVAADPDDPCPPAPGNPRDRIVVQAGWSVRTDGELALVRRDADGRLRHAALVGGTFLEIGQRRIDHAPGMTFTELDFGADAG